MGGHFLFTCDEKVHWVERKRQVHDKASSSTMTGTFFQLFINDAYNNNMNNVDILISLDDPTDSVMQTRNWWWVIVLWGHGTMLVNEHLVDKCYMEMNGKAPLGHNSKA